MCPRHFTRFRVDYFRLRCPNHRQHAHSGRACRQRVSIELSIQGFRDLESLTGLGSAGHGSSSKVLFVSSATLPVTSPFVSKTPHSVTNISTDLHSPVTLASQ